MLSFLDKYIDSVNKIPCCFIHRIADLRIKVHIARLSRRKHLKYMLTIKLKHTFDDL